MKIIAITLVSMVITACTASPSVKTNVAVNMANPASVYCHQQGGKLSTIKSRSDVTGYCTLPTGERIEIWALYHRDHK